MSDRIDVLVSRLRDRRSRKVIFLSHCLLDQNTRYLGGAGRSAAVREVVDRCLDADLGIVQVPCPEAEAWGGVLKKRLLRLYGRSPALNAALSRVALAWTRRNYVRIARRVAAQIDDYLGAGVEVVGIVGIDGSPSCGVGTTMDVPGALRAMASLQPSTVTIEQQDVLLRSNLRPGAGIFVAALRRELERRGRAVPFLAHDLFEELDGKPSRFDPRGQA